MAGLYQRRTKIVRIGAVKPRTIRDRNAIKRALAKHQYLYYDEVGRVFNTSLGGMYIADVDV